MKKILIIDDEEKLRSLLMRMIELEGFEVFEAADGKSALKKLEQQEINVVLCDGRLPDVNGIDLCKEIKAKYPLLEIIMLTAYGNIPDGVQAIKNGAFDYIVKGDDNNKIIPLLNRAIEKVELQKQLSSLKQRIDKKYSFKNIIGNSKVILDAVSLARKVAPTQATVLLLGETGTGKEIFANSIHQESAPASKSFLALNCSAFAKDLLESELFGYKAGAFTGATKDKRGLLEEANGGTLFLDEVGELQPDLQAKLLRVLESGEFIKVGDVKTTRVNVRIIAASNRDLKKEAEENKFRQDLYYRLSGFQILLPALRDRMEDIPLLAEHFAAVFATKLNKEKPKIAIEYLQVLKAQPWKGNIRELQNIIERSMILCEGDTLTAADLPLEMRSPNEEQTGTATAMDLASAEKLHIQKVLNHTKGNKAETARLLNIAVTTLYRKLEEFQIS